MRFEPTAVQERSSGRRGRAVRRFELADLTLAIAVLLSVVYYHRLARGTSSRSTTGAPRRAPATWATSSSRTTAT